jgi:hypothetical protein
MVPNGSFTRQVWKYDNGDYIGFNNAIVDFPWAAQFSTVDTNDACRLFNRVIKSMMDRFILNQTVQIRREDKPWFNSELRKLKRQRDRAQKKQWKQET